MIFVTVGMEKFPFDRLIRAVDRIASEGTIGPFFVQYGSSAAIPEHCEHARFLRFDEMLGRVQDAELVISHAGAGSVLTCADHGARTIVVPRQRAFGEHVDDHQLEFARLIARSGEVDCVTDLGDLEKAIDGALTRRGGGPEGRGRPAMADRLDELLAEWERAGR